MYVYSEICQLVQIVVHLDLVVKNTDWGNLQKIQAAPRIMPGKEFVTLALAMLKLFLMNIYMFRKRHQRVFDVKVSPIFEV